MIKTKDFFFLDKNFSKEFQLEVNSDGIHKLSLWFPFKRFSFKPNILNLLVATLGCWQHVSIGLPHYPSLAMAIVPGLQSVGNIVIGVANFSSILGMS